LSAAHKPPPAKLMTVDEFLEWTLDQPDDLRYELVAGEPVAMAPPVLDHGRTIYRVVRGLEQAIDRAGVSCEAILDSVGVRVRDNEMFVPDAMLRCGEPLPGTTREVNDPVVVVEVVSPSTRRVDETHKLIGYFRLPSIRHYLIVSVAERQVVHHERRGDGLIITHLRGDGPIPLDPPGIVLQDVFAPAA
jgi:Uma2 family endonuclease